jgi:uroporphyrinogen-III synthase
MPRRILVTRPLAQNAALLDALRQQGDTPIVLPLIYIKPYTESEHSQQCALIKNTIQRLDEFQHLIFISTNAVSGAEYWFDRYWPQLPIAPFWYAIGNATASQLAQFVDAVEQSGEAMNSESLLAHPRLQHIKDHKILIFRGAGGRNHLKEVLEQRGARVEYCEVYERQAIHYHAQELSKLLIQGIDLLTVSSGETLHLLLEQAVNDGIKDVIQSLPIVVPGKRVADIAKTKGFQQIITADNAGVAAFLSACNKQ